MLDLCPRPLGTNGPQSVHPTQNPGTKPWLRAGVPIPLEHAVEGAAVERATQAALAQAARQGISGAALTPFLLARIGETTRGASLAANIALIKHNAAVGTDIAVALAASS